MSQRTLSNFKIETKKKKNLCKMGVVLFLRVVDKKPYVNVGTLALT
jgi:hypothetical protein